MQFSKNWLKEFIKITLSDDELCDQLTSLGLEVDNYRSYQSKLTGRDTVIKLDLTPNRGDCFSILGVSRELAAINGLTLKLPKIQEIKISSKSPINVSVCDEAPKYIGRYIGGICNKTKTPPLIKERLEISGIKTIDAIVDITNYVLLELGQPLHAFDANKLIGNLSVRFAKQKEKITLLDENELKLNKDCLVIADEKKSVALAGIMGGLDTGITKKTKSIYLESAFFKPEVIRGRARKFSIQTDASTRFERGVDFNIQAFAIKRASSLIQNSAGGEFSKIQEFVKKASMPKTNNILLRTDNLNKQLGTDFNNSSVSRSLKSLGFKNSSKNSQSLKVQVPSWRFDIEIEADLIEEVARLEGYNNLPETPLKRKPRSHSNSLYRLARNSLKSMGFNEVITYSFIGESIASMVQPVKKKLIFVNNPISQNMNVMRSSLLPGLLETLIFNLNNGEEDLKIFEIGSVFSKERGDKINQKEMIGGLIAGNKEPKNWSVENKPQDFYDLKGSLENILVSSSTYDFRKANISYLHPGKTAQIYKGRKLVGHIGSVNPKLLDKLDIKGEVNFFQFDVDEVSNKRNFKFKKYSRFPMAQRDLSFIVDEDVASNLLTDSITLKAGDNIRDVNLFDVYVGKGIPEGKKSLTYALNWQAPNRTMTDIEVDKIISQLVTFLSKKYNAKLRS